MNLLEVERLVRKIAEVLQHRVPEAQARQLAQDYAEVCRTANHRLNQCAAILAQGDEPQALQLAEAPPPLLELVTRLGFRQLNEWRDYCQSHDLPVADSLDGKFIRQLGAAYGQGLASDDQLYRKYREAVLLRNDDQAVEILRAIVRRNPADPNAPRELARLENKILGAELEKLDAAMQAGDDARAVSLVQEIEALNFASAPAGEGWRRGQEARCRVLLRQAQQQRTRDAWMAAAPLLLLVHSLCEEHGFKLHDRDAQTLRELDDWVAQSHKTAETERKFQRALTEVRQLVQVAEEKNAAATPLDRTELRQQGEALGHKWREVEGFGRAVDDELSARVRKALLVSRGQLARKNLSVRNRAILATGVFAILAIGASVFFWNQRQSRDLGAELKAHRQARHVSAAETFAARMRGENARLLQSSAALRQELEATDQFLKAENRRREQCAGLLAQLQTAAAEGFSNAAPEKIQGQFDGARQAVTEAAEDFQPALHAALVSSQAKWDLRLEELRKQRLAEFEQQFRIAQQRVNGLKYDQGSETVRAALAEIYPELQSLEPLVTPGLPQLRLPADAETRFRAVQASALTFSNEVARWEQILSVWARPTTLEAYLASLKSFQQSEFARPAEKAPAGEVLGLNITEAALLAGLLLPGDPEGWADFTRQPNLNLQPPDVMPGERSRFSQLRDDENILNLMQCKITRLRPPPADVPKTWLGYARGSLGKNKLNRKTGLIYDPVESPTAVSFQPRVFDDYLLSVEEVGRTPESEVFERVGMKGLFDSRTGTNYTATLLGILDAINRETAGSPLFRAYLALRVHEIMELRSQAWGAYWAPNAAQDHRNLHELGADAIVTGDWLVPGRQANLLGGIEGHFVKARRVSYRQQAKFLNALARRTVEAGFSLAGQVGAGGQPVLSAVPPDQTELWGWTSGPKTPALLFRYRDNPGRFVMINPPLPLTPLFTFRTQRRQVLEEVRKSVSTNPIELGGYLPPLYSTAHE
jgi:hypothetical protein